MPSRTRTAASSSATLRPRAAARPSASAVPEGASTLWRWCISRISMSKAGSSGAATRSTRPSSRLTPWLMLGAQTIGTRSAERARAWVCSRSRPVVPMTWAQPFAAARAAVATLASGVENSITASAAASSASRSSVAGTPTGSRPASTPKSWPSAGWPGRSTPPANSASVVSSTSRRFVRPIRPAQPTIPIRIPRLPRALRVRGCRVPACQARCRGPMGRWSPPGRAANTYQVRVAAV